MATNPPSIVSQIEGLLPEWMVGTYRETMAPLVASVAVTLDAFKFLVDQGRMGWLPGQLDLPGYDSFDNPDALPLILRDRYLRAGLLETPFSQADRARRWLEEWARSATPYELLNQIAAILSPNPPTLRIFTQAGVWWQRDPSGLVYQFTHPGAGFAYQINADGSASITAEAVTTPLCDWDSLANPRPFGFGDPNRFWVVIYAPCNGIYLSGISGTIGDGRTIGMGKGGPDAWTIGTVAPSKEVELIRLIIQEWRAAGLRCSHVIVSFTDPIDSFNPDGTSPDYPDGTYGWPVVDDGMGTLIAARPSYARYWRAEPGGVAGTL